MVEEVVKNEIKLEMNKRELRKKLNELVDTYKDSNYYIQVYCFRILCGSITEYSITAYFKSDAVDVMDEDENIFSWKYVMADADNTKIRNAMYRYTRELHDWAVNIYGEDRVKYNVKNGEEYITSTIG